MVYRFQYKTLNGQIKCDWLSRKLEGIPFNFGREEKIHVTTFIFKLRVKKSSLKANIYLRFASKGSKENEIRTFEYFYLRRMSFGYGWHARPGTSTDARIPWGFLEEFRLPEAAPPIARIEMLTGEKDKIQFNFCRNLEKLKDSKMLWSKDNLFELALMILWEMV